MIEATSIHSRGCGFWLHSQWLRISALVESPCREVGEDRGPGAVDAGGQDFTAAIWELPRQIWGGLEWGVGICYDVEFPEFARALAVAGADVLLVPTAVPAVEEGVPVLGEAWHYSATQTSTLQVPARALENGVVVAFANHCGPGFTGRSCIATPFGRNAVLLGDEPGVGVLEVPPGALERARGLNTYLRVRTVLRRASRARSRSLSTRKVSSGEVGEPWIQTQHAVPSIRTALHAVDLRLCS